MRPSPKVSVTRTLSLLPSYLPQDGASRSPNRTSSQVKHITRIVRTVLLLTMVVSSCVAYPRVEVPRGDNPSAVYFKSRFCQPVSESELQRRMGPAFDNSRMATSDESMKRSLASDTVHGTKELSDTDFEEYPQSDDPNAGYIDSDDMYEDGDFSDSSDKHEPGEAETLHTHKKYEYMRKRREVSDDENTLHLKLLLRGNRNKKIRKQLKNKLREKLRKSSILNKKPPWECQMNTSFQKMTKGMFPFYVKTGRCVTNKCFYRLYNCIPKKYPVKVLKKDPDQCNPIPTVGNATTYEERWFFVTYYATVGCDCARKQKPKRRKRH